MCFNSLFWYCRKQHTPFSSRQCDKCSAEGKSSFEWAWWKARSSRRKDRGAEKQCSAVCRNCTQGRTLGQGSYIPSHTFLSHEEALERNTVSHSLETAYTFSCNCSSFGWFLIYKFCEWIWGLLNFYLNWNETTCPNLSEAYFKSIFTLLL